MKTLRDTLSVLILFALFILAASCSVISKDLRRTVREDLGFRALLEHPERYKGSTVLLGGYILETRNLPEITELVVLQAPLSFRDEPGPKDASEGRFIALHNGFLDPEIFSENRKVTVAGILTGIQTETVNNHPHPHLVIKSRETYLWPEFEGYRYYPRPYPDPFYPCPFYDDPFYRSPYCW